MASDECAFLRPIVIDSDNNSVSVGGVSETIGQGVYPNVAALLNELNAETAGYTWGFSAHGTPNDPFRISVEGGGVFAVTWIDTALRDLLGFTGNLSGEASYTATYAPQNCWLPTRSRADNGEWTKDLKMQWSGIEGRSGAVAGLRSGAGVYRTSLDFEALGAAEVLYSRCTSAIQQVRCLEYFVEQTRECWSSVNNPSPSGFYFYPDWTNITVAATSTFDSGDASKFNYSSSPDIYAFCQFDSDWFPRIKPTLSVRSDYFDVSVDIHAATAPTWTGE